MALITVVGALLLCSLCINCDPSWQAFDIQKSSTVVKVANCEKARVMLTFKDALTVSATLLNVNTSLYKSTSLTPCENVASDRRMCEVQRCKYLH